MLNSSPDPGLVSLSASVYRALLVFYPARFKREYGPHMAQVFRDCCLKTYRQSGPPGLLAMWAITLFDWLKTVIEEQFNRGTEMTQSKFIRLSGWGMILGAITLTLGFLAEADTVRGWMYNLLGTPDTPEGFNFYRTVSDSLGGWLAFVGLLLLVAGIAGLRLRYGKLAGPFGHMSLLLSIISGGVAVFGLMGAFLEWDGAWYIMMFAMAGSFAFLALFGVAALRAKPMPRWNGLPILAGVGFPLLGLGLVSGWIENGLILMIFASLALLGYTLQADAPPEASLA